jgi:ABC-2 type transport system ATP-binding protein
VTAPDNDTLVEAEGLTRLYGRLRAVDNLSFSLRKGQVLGFLGPNGAGKSTAMQMLCGALAPSEGRIAINGVDLLESPLQAKQHIGFLPERPPLYTDLTVDEYLNYCSRLHRIPAGARPAAIDAAKRRCGLAQVGRRLIGNLSKGYQQRAGIAQAVVHAPPVVILDEPTAGLDPIQIREIRQLIGELGGDHGVILSTHILPEVQMTCSDVQIIHNGRLVFRERLDKLNQQTGAGSLLVQFGRSPADAELQAVAGVERVESLGGGRFRLHFGDGGSPAEEVVRLSVANDWALRELTPEARGLEQIFLELTSAEPDGAAPPTTAEAAA